MQLKLNWDIYKMKKTQNQAITATQNLLDQAKILGIPAQILATSKPRTRRYSANGSTAVPQKIILLDGIRMSVGQGRQYLAARGKAND